MRTAKPRGELRHAPLRGLSGHGRPGRRSGIDAGWFQPLIACDCRSTETNSSGASPLPKVTNLLRTTIDTLAQKRYLGTGPKFINVGHKVLYRWTDVLKWLQHNTIQWTDDPR
jgi:hypothetical protein